MTVRLNAKFVDRWSAEYAAGMGEREPRLLSTVGPAAASRGHYVLTELVDVAAWKTTRSRSRIARNSQAEVVDITSAAFAAAQPVQHRILTLLSGVAVPTASALLTIAFPTVHTVIDVRSTEALARLGEWDGAGGYPTYLAVCRRIADRARTDLRSLDRALWKWSQAGYPT